MSLEDEVTKIMSDALNGNPVAQRALIDGTPIISNVGSADMVSIMESIMMGNRAAIIHIARRVDGSA